MTYFHLLWWKGTFVMEQSTLIANDKWSVIEILAREGMMHLLALDPLYGPLSCLKHHFMIYLL